MIKMQFFDDGTLLAELALPDGSPIPRLKETVQLPGSTALFDVIGIAYRYVADGSNPEVILRLEDF